MKVAEWTSSLVHCPKLGLFGWPRGASERGQRIGCTAAGTSLWGQAVCMPKPHNRGAPYRWHSLCTVYDHDSTTRARGFAFPKCPPCADCSKLRENPLNKM